MNGTGARTQRTVGFESAQNSPEAMQSELSRAPARRRSLAHGPHVQFAYAVIDAILVFLGGMLTFSFRFGAPSSFAELHQLFHETAAHTYLGFFLLYAALMTLACATQDLYRTPRDRSSLQESARVAKATGISTVLLVLFVFISGYKDISRLVVLLTGAQNFLTLSGWRCLKRKIIVQRTLRGIGTSRVLVVGFDNLGRALASWFTANPQLGYKVCGFLDTYKNGDARVLGTIRDLRAVVLAHFVDELFVTLSAERDLVKQSFIEARKLGLNLHVVPDIYDGLGWRAALHRIGGFPVMDLHEHHIPAVGLALKRLTDVVIALAGLVLSAPLLAMVAVWIRLDSPGPAFYVAPRVGWKGRKFRCYKLRTMGLEADQKKNALRCFNERNGPFFKITDDPRITRCGRWLRRFSLDELPQLWNVLLGDMSLVGPRPHPIDDFERYDIEHLRRLDVKPGITGLWQIKARRDPSFETNVALDLEYIEKWNLLLDIKILLNTVPAILKAEGR